MQMGLRDSDREPQENSRGLRELRGWGASSFLFLRPICVIRVIRGYFLVVPYPLLGREMQ